MLELIGWNVGMTATAAILLVLGAAILGAVAQLIGRVEVGYEWIFTAVAALVGGWFGSEAFGTLSAWGPVFEDLYILPALMGGVVLGGVVDIVVRRSTGGHYLEPRPI
jgi:uncharacterized membrane protein YeaQ/YmgE (transglycosylase-associated protein family)